VQYSTVQNRTEHYPVIKRISLANQYKLSNKHYITPQSTALNMTSYNLMLYKTAREKVTGERYALQQNTTREINLRNEIDIIVQQIDSYRVGETITTSYDDSCTVEEKERQESRNDELVNESKSEEHAATHNTSEHGDIDSDIDDEGAMIEHEEPQGDEVKESTTQKVHVRRKLDDYLRPDLDEVLTNQSVS
jgi:hypothetical protein